MLVKDDRALLDDDVLSVISNGVGTELLPCGIYKIGHFGSSAFPDRDDYDHYPEFPEANDLWCYGVCDNPQQLLDMYPFLVKSDRKFFIHVHKLLKSECPSKGGWRWHKWGPYIGTQTPTTEYLYDEPVIEEVWVYHILEKKD